MRNKKDLPQPIATTPRLLSLAGLAAHWDVCPKQIATWARDPRNEFPLLYLGEKTVRVREDEALAWAHQHMARLAERVSDPVLADRIKTLVRLRRRKANEREAHAKES